MTTKRKRRGFAAKVDAGFEKFLAKRGLTTSTWRHQKNKEARARMLAMEESEGDA